MNRIEGYHDEATLPVQRGHVVTIRKGTMVRHNGETKPAGRTYKVTVHHMLSGSSEHKLMPGHKDANEHDMVSFHTNPAVVWPGSGGYWSEADINDIPEAMV